MFNKSENRAFFRNDICFYRRALKRLPAGRRGTRDKLGGKTSSSVSGKTSYVVVGKDPGSKKGKPKNRNKNTKRKEFLELTGNHGG